MAAEVSRSTRLAVTSWTKAGRHLGFAAALGAAGREALRAAAFFAGFFAWTFFFAGLFFDAFLAMGFPRCCGAFVHGEGGRSRRFARPPRDESGEPLGHAGRRRSADAVCQLAEEIGGRRGLGVDHVPEAGAGALGGD